MPEQEPKHSCALRALTLCDGHVLEDPEHALIACLCTAIAWLDSRGSEELSGPRRAYRQRLIERTLAAPQLPL